MSVRKTEIRINGKNYHILCDDDQADHVRQLADEVDSRAKQIAATTPHANETMLLLLTCLILADELYEAREEAGILHEKILRSQHDLSDVLPSESVSDRNHKLTGLLHDVTEALEQITKRINKL
jgi:cell division protein ZapA (FtsZ GTPase activity inhibitor)